VGKSAEAAAGVPDAAAQLTGLRSLALYYRTPGFELSPTSALLPLTALTALECLKVAVVRKGVYMGNKVGLG
jgi:hypothetical protein